MPKDVDRPPLPSLKASEQVALKLVRDAVARGLSAGDALPAEAALTAEYGVSRPSLREALRLLQFQGLIRVRPGPGASTAVGTPDPKSLARTIMLYLHVQRTTYREMIQTFLYTEGMIAADAAANPDAEARRAAMEPFLKPEAHSCGQDGIDFHDRLYALAPNSMLSLMARAIHEIATDEVIPLFPDRMADYVLQDHKDVARAVIDGDRLAAMTLMMNHIAHFEEFFSDHWPDKFGDRVDWNLFA